MGRFKQKHNKHKTMTDHSIIIYELFHEMDGSLYGSGNTNAIGGFIGEFIE